MKKKLLSIFIVVFLVGYINATLNAQENNKNQTVYVTKTGKKYHEAGCRYLSKSSIPIKLSDAAARYSPCSVCNPPVLNSDQSKKSETKSYKQENIKENYSGQCQAITKKGTQCKRKAQPGSIYCWQHNR